MMRIIIVASVSLFVSQAQAVSALGEHRVRTEIEDRSLADYIRELVETRRSHEMKAAGPAPQVLPRPSNLSVLVISSAAAAPRGSVPEPSSHMAIDGHEDR